MLRIDRVLALVSGLTLVGVTAAAAQVTDACPVGQVEMGTVGIGELRCENCSVGVDIVADSGRGFGRRLWDFRSEPTIGRIVAGSPASGRLRAGDVVTAIDGQLITTRAGGIRYGAIVPGTPVTFRVRRGDRELEVTLTPVGECARVSVLRSELPAPAKAPRPAAPPRADVRPPREAPAAVPAPRPAPPPRPWPSTSALGFSIQCSDCSLQRLSDPERWVWSFSASPVIERVEPGSPAAQAGLSAGDVLTRIDGDRLVTAEGGQRFGAVQEGDIITLTYRRGSGEQTVTLVARGGLRWTVERAPAPDRIDPADYSGSAEITRFSGSLGDAVIQVTGGRVTVTRTDDEIIIRSSDITVRITRSREQ